MTPKSITPSNHSTNGRIEIVDSLRGLAALAVCWFHFTYCERDWLGTNWLIEFSGYGRLGVEIFFVISGFVIPYALARSDYKIARYGKFLLKRIVRIDPPYLASIALSIVIGYGLMLTSKSYANRPPIHSLAQLAAHFGYLNTFFQYEWINPVYWSLALEFQYYLLIGLCFPLLNSNSKRVRVFTCVGLSLLSAIPGASFVFSWLPLFLLGFITFYKRTNRISTITYVFCATALCFVVQYVFHELPVVIASLATAVAIAFVNYSVGPLRRLGTISYSLYLVHYPIGKFLLSAAKHFELSSSLRWLAVFATIAVSLLASWLMYRLVEGPAQIWASWIRYVRKRPTHQAVTVIPLQP